MTDIPKTKATDLTMSIERRAIRNESEWLSWRAHDVTASEIAAVFDLHPYKTRRELWADKSGLNLADRRDSAVMRRGKIMEPSVAAAVALERPEWKLTKCTDYYSDRNRRIGATPDFWVEGDPRGLGVLQAKTASPSAFAQHYDEDKPPFWIVLQNATELMLTEAEGATWGAVAVLIVDPWRDLRCPVYDIPRNAKAERKLIDGVQEFWEAVSSGEQPKADYSRDAALISAMFPEEAPGLEIDLSGDNELPRLLEARADAKATASAAKKQIETADAEIKAKMGDAARALFAGGWSATWKVEPRGELFVPASKPRVLRVKQKKEPK